MARADIKRGDIWMVDLGMMEKRRPVVVLSVEAFVDLIHAYGIGVTSSHSTFRYFL